MSEKQEQADLVHEQLPTLSGEEWAPIAHKLTYAQLVLIQIAIEARTELTTERHQELLRTIRNLSMDSISPIETCFPAICESVNTREDR